MSPGQPGEGAVPMWYITAASDNHPLSLSLFLSSRSTRSGDLTGVNTVPTSCGGWRLRESNVQVRTVMFFTVDKPLYSCCWFYLTPRCSLSMYRTLMFFSPRYVGNLVCNVSVSGGHIASLNLNSHQYLGNRLEELGNAVKWGLNIEDLL